MKRPIRDGIKKIFIWFSLLIMAFPVSAVDKCFH